MYNRYTGENVERNKNFFEIFSKFYINTLSYADEPIAKVNKK